MRAIYIGGGQKSKKSDGVKWKVFTFLFLFLALTGGVLNLAAPMIVERWINQQGASAAGYAFSIREVDLSISKGQLALKDVKVFNPKTNTELVEAPNLSIHFSWADFFLYNDKKVSVLAEEIDIILSKDFSTEMDRIKTSGLKQNDFYLDALDGKIAKLNVIEQKEDQSRTVLELNGVNLKVKNVSLLSVNKKSEFLISSTVADGGNLSLTGKTIEENGKNHWSIQGSLKQVPSDIFNKIAGDKLPFSFNESKLNAEISALSEQGKVKGEIIPDIKRLNLLEEKPGLPVQSIARALTDELTFSLPFTLKEELTVQYGDTYRKLKAYRKDPALTASAESVQAQTSQPLKGKKPFSLWPF